MQSAVDRHNCIKYITSDQFQMRVPKNYLGENLSQLEININWLCGSSLKQPLLNLKNTTVAMEYTWPPYSYYIPR